MFDLYDLLGPRVYVVSDEQYNKMLKRQRDAKVEALTLERDRLKTRLNKLDEEIAQLKG